MQTSPQFFFYDHLISLFLYTFFVIIYSVLLLLHVISAIPAPASSTSLKEQRNKKAVNVSQSPIIYVQRLENFAHQPEAKIVANGRSNKRTKGKKTLDNKSLASSSSSISNHELLTSLGLGKLPSPSNHHRKRLATQSRHVSRPDDSRIFVVKLPPNPYYYSHVGNKIVGVNEPNAIVEKSNKVRDENV